MYACKGLTNFGYEAYENLPETEMMYIYLTDDKVVKSQQVNGAFLADFSHLESLCNIYHSGLPAAALSALAFQPSLQNPCSLLIVWRLLPSPDRFGRKSPQVFPFKKK
jgi:hypothetical protein